MPQIDFSRLTGGGRSFTALLPDAARVRSWIRAVPACVAAADGTVLVVLAVRHDWWDFASLSVVSAAVGIPWAVLKGLALFSQFEDARTRRLTAATIEARERRATAQLELSAAARTAEAISRHRALGQAGPGQLDPELVARAAASAANRRQELQAQAGAGPRPSGTTASERRRRAAPPALPAANVAPVVLDYEVEGLLPPGTEIGFVFRDGAGTDLVVIDSPDGRRLARLNDMQLIRRAEVVPPLSVTGGVEVTILPLELDTTHATTGKVAHA